MNDWPTNKGGSKERNYWVEARDWSDTELSKTASQIIDVVERGVSVLSWNDKFNCEFLFELSRRSLPEVRGNYYWPSAYAEVVRRSEMISSEPTQHKFEKYFREAISSAYCREVGLLQKQGVHHKYVALIFQQAGIGKDRNRILKEFLEFLVEHYSSRDDSDTYLIVSQALEEFVKGQPDSSRVDVSFLTGVLTRIGQEVMVLVRALEREPGREEISNWTWDQLRSFWLSRAGVNLDELTPSAGHVILELISHLSTLWLRSKIFRLASSGKVSVTLPGRTAITACSRYRDIPIGPAEISFRGEKRSIMIVDHMELDPQKFSRLDKDVWHWLDDEYTYKLSKTGFDVLISGAKSQKAVPYFIGKRLQNAEQVGYFWGGYAPFGVIEKPDSLNVTNRHSRADLSIHYGFSWRNDRLFVELKGFRTSKQNEEKCSLDIGGATVWSGALRNSRPTHLQRKWIDTTRLSIAEGGKTEVRFTNESGETLERTITLWPLSDEAFLVVGRKVYRNRALILLWDEGGQRPEILLFTTRDDAGLDMQNLSVIGESQVSILGRNFKCLKLRLVTPKEARVQLGVSWWGIDCRRTIDFSYVTESDIIKNEVIVSGVGNVRVVGDLKEIQLHTNDAKCFQESGLGFWVGTTGNEIFCTVDRDDWSSAEMPSVIKLYDVIDRNGIELELGVNRFVVGTPQSKSSKTFNYFLLPEAISVQSSRILQPSRISFEAGDPNHGIVSDDDVTLALLDERKMVRVRLGGGDWEVWFRWKPRIFDLTIAGLFGAQNNYSFSLAKHCCGNAPRRLPCHLYSYGGSDKPQIHLLGNAVDCIPGTDIDLLPLLFSNNRLPDIDEVCVLATHGADRIDWTLDLRPTIEQFECTVVGELSGCVELSVKIHAVGFKQELFTLNCVSDTTVLESREVTLDLSVAIALPIEISLAVSLLRILDNHLNILILRNSIEIARTSVFLPTKRQPDSEVTLSNVIGVYRRTGSLAMFPKILEEAIRLVGNGGNAINIIRNVMPQVSGKGSADDDNWLNVGLKSLEYIAGEAVQNVQIPDQITESADLRAISIAFWLVLADKQAARGTLIPAKFDRAMTLLENTLNYGGIASDLARDMGRLAYAFAAGLPLRYEITHTALGNYKKGHELPIASKAAISMATISSNFKNWLETI